MKAKKTILFWRSAGGNNKKNCSSSSSRKKQRRFNGWQPLPFFLSDSLLFAKREQLRTCTKVIKAISKKRVKPRQQKGGLKEEEEEIVVVVVEEEDGE